MKLPEARTRLAGRLYSTPGTRLLTFRVKGSTPNGDEQNGSVVAPDGATAAALATVEYCRRFGDDFEVTYCTPTNGGEAVIGISQ